MKHRIVAMALTAVVVAALPSRAQAQEVRETGPDTVVFTPERGKVTFAHGRHAKDFECKSCHHESKTEKPLEKENQKCTSCHTDEAAPPMKTTRRMAMHDTEAREGTCYNCHTKKAAEGKTVPERCSDCHKREERPASHASASPGRWLAYFTRR